MLVRCVLRRATWIVLLVVCLSGQGIESFATPLASSESSAETAGGHEAIRSGSALERSRRWLEAIQHYEESLKKWPDNKELQYGLRRAKIHFSIQRRYADGSFDESLLNASRQEVLSLFDSVLDKIRSHYVEPVSSTSFIAHGTESLYLALADEKFLERNLPGIDSRRVKEVRTILREQYWNKPVSNQSAARETVLEVCRLCENRLGLSATSVVLEYVFGGCNALDDYSSCLTPDRLDDLYGNIEGEFVGIGIEMKGEPGKGMLLVNVLPDSPADQGGLRPGEYIVSVNGVDCREMSTDEAAKLLRGTSGSTVRLGVKSPFEDDVRFGQFTRRSVHVKSIPVARIIDSEAGIGYIQMTGFQKSSATELDEALTRLQRQGMRALIWDLRGNPGGLLTAAVEVLDRFIDDGMLVSTKGRTRDQNWSYSAHRLGTSKLPLVLLVDGESASASEIVAGAIRDHRRGAIVGRQTFGKWSVQSIFPIQGSTGLRLTTAKFYSPNGQTLGKVGVRPDIVVELAESHETLFRGASSIQVDTDRDLQKGLDLLRRQMAQK